MKNYFSKNFLILFSFLAITLAMAGNANVASAQEITREDDSSLATGAEELEAPQDHFFENASVFENCVEGRSCADLRNGTCYIWNSTKACGRYCATGRRCGYSKNNTCFVWEVTAACGRNVCTVNRTCGASQNGTCFFYNENVSCN
jgi:hypothetical protein